MAFCPFSITIQQYRGSQARLSSIVIMSDPKKKNRPSRTKLRDRSLALRGAEDRKRSEDMFLIPDAEYEAFEIPAGAPGALHEYRQLIGTLDAKEQQRALDAAEAARLERLARTGSAVPVARASATSKANQKVEDLSIPVENHFSALSKAQARKKKKEEKVSSAAASEWA